MWSRKMLIVPMAPTITVIVIVAPEVRHVTFSDCDGQLLSSSFFYGGAESMHRIVVSFPQHLILIYFVFLDPKIGLLKFTYK